MQTSMGKTAAAEESLLGTLPPIGESAEKPKLGKIVTFLNEEEQSFDLAE